MAWSAPGRSRDHRPSRAGGSGPQGRDRHWKEATRNATSQSGHQFFPIGVTGLEPRGMGPSGGRRKIPSSSPLGAAAIRRGGVGSLPTGGLRTAGTLSERGTDTARGTEFDWVRRRAAVVYPWNSVPEAGPVHGQCSSAAGSHPLIHYALPLLQHRQPHTGRAPRPHAASAAHGRRAPRADSALTRAGTDPELAQSGHPDPVFTLHAFVLIRHSWTAGRGLHGGPNLAPAPTRPQHSPTPPHSRTAGRGLHGGPNLAPAWGPATTQSKSHLTHGLAGPGLHGGPDMAPARARPHHGPAHAPLTRDGGPGEPHNRGPARPQHVP